jgi:hypothetical protein
MDQRNQTRIKTETLTLGFKGLTPPLSTRSTDAAFWEDVLLDSHPWLKLVSAHCRSHHRLCVGRSSSCRAGSRHARAFTGRGTEPPCAHLGVPPLETPGSSSLAPEDASVGRWVPAAPTSQECVGRAPPWSRSTVVRLLTDGRTRRWKGSRRRCLSAVGTSPDPTRSREDRERRRERGSWWRCLLKDAITSGLLVVRPSVFHLTGCGAEWERGKLGFWGHRLGGFDRLRLTRSRPIESNGWHRLGMFSAHGVAQVGKDFHGPSPGCGLVHAGTLGTVGPWAQFSLWAVFRCMNSKEIDFPLCFKYCPHMQRN